MCKIRSMPKQPTLCNGSPRHTKLKWRVGLRDAIHSLSDEAIEYVQRFASGADPKKESNGAKADESKNEEEEEEEEDHVMSDVSLSEEEDSWYSCLLRATLDCYGISAISVNLRSPCLKGYHSAISVSCIHVTVNLFLRAMHTSMCYWSFILHFK